MCNNNSNPAPSICGKVCQVDCLAKCHAECKQKDVCDALKYLHEWCTRNANGAELHYSPMLFYPVFQKTLFVTLSKYEKNKSKTWGKKRVWLPALAVVLTALVSFFAAVMLATISQLTFSDMKEIRSFLLNSGSITEFIVALLMIITLLGLGWTLFEIYKQNDKQRDDRQYKETWVRHSSAYHRMVLALNEFYLSSQLKLQPCQTTTIDSQNTADEKITDNLTSAEIDAFHRLVEKFFAIQEANLDQFEHNLSKNGLVEHPSDKK